MQDLIIYKYPEKTILQNPVDLHKFLNFRDQDSSIFDKGHLDYEQRKDAITKIGQDDPILSCMPAWKNNTRKIFKKSMSKNERINDRRIKCFISFGTCYYMWRFTWIIL